MDKLKFGDIVLLRFPFTDGKSYKRRPALIINDFEDGDIIVCRITSQIYKTKNDVFIDEWKKAGLKLPSVVRIHKIATLQKDLVEIIMGQTNDNTKNKIMSIISKITE